MPDIDFTRTITVLVGALVENNYDQAETVTASLAKAYGYDAETVFKDARQR